MERLGLWGAGTSFKDFEVFLDSLTRRGLGKIPHAFKIISSMKIGKYVG